MNKAEQYRLGKLETQMVEMTRLLSELASHVGCAVATNGWNKYIIEINKEKK